MEIYRNLAINEDVEIDQEIIDCAARVIQQYAMEDELIDNGNSDIKLERLMRAAERYLQRYMDVVNAHQKDPAWVSSWQKSQSEVFNNHASEFEVLYRGVSHMQEPPYFMTQWSLCFLVDAALKVHNINSIDDYLKLSSGEHKDLEYTVRFCENLLQSIHAQFIAV